MNNINNILVAVELDNESETVIEYGITLGLMLDAEVRCLHVSRPLGFRVGLDEDGNLMDDFNDLDEVEQDANIQGKMDSDIATLRSKVLVVLKKMGLEEHNVMANVRADFAVPGILAEAEETAADLIIVGAHVDFRRKDMSVSNLSKEIISKSEKSAVVVPSTYGNRNLDHMCMFVNFEFGELTMMQDMIEVATRNEIHLSFVHVLDTGEKVVDVEKKMKVYKRLFLQDEDHSYISFKMKSGDVTETIDELINDMDVDLISIKTKKKHWNLFGLQKSFDSKILNHLRVPLYVWRN